MQRWGGFQEHPSGRFRQKQSTYPIMNNYSVLGLSTFVRRLSLIVENSINAKVKRYFNKTKNNSIITRVKIQDMVARITNRIINKDLIYD